MEVLLVRRQMFGEFLDALREEGNLDFRRTRIALLDGIGFDDFGLACGVHRHRSLLGP